MQKHRIEKTSYSVLVLIIGLVVLIASVLAAMMYPSRTEIGLGILIAAVFLMAGAFAANPQLLRDILTSRKSWLWVNDILLILSIIGIGVMLTYIGSRRHVRYDFTRDRLFSISDMTIKQLQGLKKEIIVTAFFPAASVEGELVKDLLSEYRRYTDQVKFKMVDPFRDPITTKAMNVRAPGTVVVQCETNRKDIGAEELFQRPAFMGRQQREQPKFQGEQAITSAILNVTSGIKRKIMFAVGHDEPSITAFKGDGLAGLQQFLVKENYEVVEEPLTNGIAPDVSVLALIDPKKALHESETTLLKNFVFEKKGKLMIAMDPQRDVREFENFLSGIFGVRMNAEIIINEQPISQDAAMVVPFYEMHPIVKDLQEKKLGALMQLVRGMQFEEKPEWKYAAFLKTPSNTYTKKISSELFQGNIKFNPATDARGPHTVGLALEGQGVASGARVVFFGDGDFMSNNLLRVQGNNDLIINSFNWLSGQEHLISIRPKSLEFSQLDPAKLDSEAKTRIMIFCVIVAPLLVVFVGGLVWFRRRM
jgi:ABC-type uncharacterized transport system involved in gliding motility auxiliary subunit